jgi:hypothetical protein
MVRGVGRVLLLLARFVLAAIRCAYRCGLLGRSGVDHGVRAAFALHRAAHRLAFSRRLKRAHPASGGVLDPASRHALERCALKLAFLLTFALVPLPWGPRPSLVQLALLLAALNGLLAWVNRERLDAASLNHWDEAAVFLGTDFLIRGLG